MNGYWGGCGNALIKAGVMSFIAFTAVTPGSDQYVLAEIAVQITGMPANKASGIRVSAPDPRLWQTTRHCASTNNCSNASSLTGGST